jgi:hypothetical protein
MTLRPRPFLAARINSAAGTGNVLKARCAAYPNLLEQVSCGREEFIPSVSFWMSHSLIFVLRFFDNFIGKGYNSISRVNPVPRIFDIPCPRPAPGVVKNSL